MPSPTLAPLRITAEEREVLERWLGRSKTGQALAMRARIVLAAGEGKSNNTVSRELAVNVSTVRKWRGRYLELGPDGLLDEPRPGVPRTITDDQIEAVIVRTLETMPGVGTHWNTRAVAEVSRLSQNSVSRTGPETFKLSTDPLFVEKLRDIVGLFMNPTEHALVLCATRRPTPKPWGHTQPLLPMRLGRPERRTHDYKRHGTTSRFAALDVATAKVIGQCHRQHRSREFRAVLNRVGAVIPADQQEVHLVLDSQLARRTPAAQRPLHAHICLLAQPRRACLCELTEKQTRRGVFRNTRELEGAIASYLRHQNGTRSLHMDQECRCHPR